MNPPSTYPRRRSLVALAASVALHVALGLFFWLHHAPPAAVAPAHQVIELTVFETTVAPRVVAAPVAPAPALRQASKGARRGALGPVPAAAAVAQAGPVDSPRAIALVPGSDFAVRLPGAGEADAPRGHTETNSPDQQPDPVAMNEYRAEKAQRSVQDLADHLMGEAGSGAGLLDPYFTQLVGAVRGEAAAVAPPVPKKDAQQKFAQALAPWLNPAARFGATGNPMQTDGSEFSTLPIERATRGMGDGTSGINDTGFARSLEGAQQLLAVTDIGRREVRKAQLVTVLELFQVRDGALADATIVKSSGFPDFDEYALQRARKALARLEEAPESGMGLSPEGWRSVWRFSFTPPSVTVELLRVVKGGKKTPFGKSVE